MPLYLNKEIVFNQAIDVGSEYTEMYGYVVMSNKLFGIMVSFDLSVVSRLE